MTHTYATLQIPPQFYNYVRKKLIDAGYGHAVNDEKKHLDMTGIALSWGGGDVKPKKS